MGRSLLLGTVAELPTRRDAQARLDEKLLAVNSGSSRPESSVTFGWFVEQQWKPLVFATFKASTQHRYRTVLANHVLPAWKDWRLRDIERLPIQQWVDGKFARKTGWQTVRRLDSPRERASDGLKGRRANGGRALVGTHHKLFSTNPESVRASRHGLEVLETSSPTQIAL